MIRLIFLNILIFFLGYFFTVLIVRKSLNVLEKTGIAIGSGYALTTFFFLLASWTGLKITFFNIIIFLLLGIGVELYLLHRSGALVWTMKEFSQKGKAVWRSKHNILDWILLFVTGSLVATEFYKALGFVFDAWDEYSFWGMAAKAIYAGNSALLIKVGLLPGFEKYPLFLPIASALNNIAIGNFGQNFARLINPLILVGLVLFLAGFLQRLKLNKTEILLFIILFLSSGSVFSQMSSILYADLAMGYFYSVAVLLFLLNFIEKPKKEYYILSGVFFAFSAWTKIEGSQIAILTISLLAVFDYFFIEGRKIKDIIAKNGVVLAIAVSMPLIWSLFGRVAGLNPSSWSTFLFRDLHEKITNLGTIVGHMRAQTILSASWPIFWLLVLLGFAISVILFTKKPPIMIMLSVMLLNFVFLLASYIFVFSINEAIIANSFGRYIIHFFPIALVFLAYLYKELKVVYEQKVLT